MSTAYGYYCRTCEVTSPLEDRKARQVEEFFPLRHDVAKVFAAFALFDTAEVHAEFNIEYAQEEEDGVGILEWLANHHDHNVCMTDEYGYKYDEEFKRIE